MNSLSESLNNSHSQLIKSVFSDLEKQKDSKFSYEEISQYLSKKSGKIFNNELLIEIFHSVDLTQESSITAEEFLSGYQKTEFMLTSQITDLKQQISENISNLSKTQKNLIEIRSNGKNLDNNLYLTVQNVKNIESPYKCKVVVKVICDGRELVTEPRSLNDLVWDTSYTVPVSTGQGSIVLQVCSWEFGKIRNVLYELSIPFCALAKQELHEDALPLNPVEQGRNSNACLALAIQWIYDLNVYLEGMVKDYEDAIKEDKNQLEILKNFWNELKAPTDAFGLPDWIKQNQELAQVERVVSSKVQSFFEKVEFFQDREISGRTVKWEKVVTFCLTCFGIISLFNCFQQPAFFNITLLVYAILHFVKRENLAFHFRVLAAGLILSQFNDVIWAMNHVSFEINSSIFTRKIEFYTFWINFCLKFVYTAVFWKVSIDNHQ